MATSTATPAATAANKIAVLTADTAATAERLTTMRGRRDRAQAALDNLRVEEQKLARRLAAGETNAAAVNDLALRINAAALAVSGFDATVRELQTAYDGLFHELAKMQMQEQKRNEQQTIVDLESEAVAIVARLAHLLSVTAAPDFARLSKVRGELQQTVDDAFRKNGHKSFPIPENAAAARRAQKLINEQLARQVTPILKSLS